MPDRPPEQEHRFPCTQCGADMRFAPGEGQLVCDHCGNTQAIERSALPAIREIDFRGGLEAALPEQEIEETTVVSCSNCGATFELPPDAHAGDCPFCATPIVTGTGTHRHIKPRGVLPFALGEAEARRAMNDWLGRLWFAPSGLQQYARKGRRMQGIYVPYWTFDADTRSRYQGDRGDYYYTSHTVMRDGKPVQVRQRHTRWRHVSGQVARRFDDLLVLASNSLPRRYTDALEPWDLGALAPYQPEYLAGFRAEAYGVALDEGYAIARERMDNIIARDVRFDIGGDVQRIDRIDTAVSDVTFKHILLPVWLAAYKYRGKTYRFVVNGQTGRVQGQRPWSSIKIALAVLAVAIAAAIAGYFYAQQQGTM